MPLKSFGFWRFGKEYLEAYLIIKKAKENLMELFGVKFYLLGHSIESSLKAFLLAKDFTETQLKNEFGHNLEALLDLSVINGLNEIVALTNEDVESIKILNLYYSKKEFEYFKGDGKTVPAYIVIEEIARKLVVSIHNQRYPRINLNI